MKKKLLNMLKIFVIILTFFTYANAQFGDCDCPFPTDTDAVCVVDEIYDLDSNLIAVDTFVMPSECIALCWGFSEENIIGQCDLIQNDTTFNDCDCPFPTDSDMVCVVEEYYDCDSVLVVDTFPAPSECIALCWGFTEDQIIGQCDWFDNDTTFNDCDCPFPTDSDAVCVVEEIYDTDSTLVGVDTIVMPSECLALCWGFTEEQIIGQCDWIDNDTTFNDCDCPFPTDSDIVCVVEEYYDCDSVLVVDTFPVPSECIALCWGFTEDQIIGQCDWFDNDTTFNDCDCPFPTDSDAVCVVQEIYDADSTLVGVDTIVMPSECLALCWGFTEEQIIGQCDWIYNDTLFNDCNCPVPDEDDAVCVTGDIYIGDSLLYIQDTFWMPSECYALCLGFTEEQILGNCDVDSSYTYEFLTSTKEIPNVEKLHDITASPNPLDNYFYIDMSKIKFKKAKISITGMDGRVALQKTVTSGGDKIRINTMNFIPGVYIVNIKTEKGFKALKIIKK